MSQQDPSRGRPAESRGKALLSKRLALIMGAITIIIGIALVVYGIFYRNLIEALLYILVIAVGVYVATAPWRGRVQDK